MDYIVMLLVGVMLGIFIGFFTAMLMVIFRKA